MDKIRIIAAVKFNSWLAYVLNRDVKFTYTKIDRETIIGEDEGLLTFFKYDGSIYPFGKTAFGGREFILKLSDGTEEHCHGQWWDGMSKAAIELFNPENLVHFTFSTIDELKKCYVYSGCTCDRLWLENLESEYKGKIYEYYEYEKIIKGIK